MAEIKVGRRDYALNVKVTPERDTFKVRETARVAVEVTDSDGKPAANGEIALAAVDEGLLELMDNASWNILEALLGERPVEVSTATAQGQVIGKRHFGKKAVAAGGGGGRGGARELFDTLLLWKGRVALDAQGRATLDDSAQRFAHELPRRRHRERGRGEIRPRRDDGAHDAGPDAVLGAAAGRARAGRLQRDVHAEEHDRAAAQREVRVDRARPAGRRQERQDAGERRPGGRARRRRSEARFGAGQGAGGRRAVVLGDRRDRRGRRQRPAAHHAESDRSASGARLPGDARAARQAARVSRSSGRPTPYPAAAACAST